MRFESHAYWCKICGLVTAWEVKVFSNGHHQGKCSVCGNEATWKGRPLYTFNLAKEPTHSIEEKKST